MNQKEEVDLYSPYETNTACRCVAEKDFFRVQHDEMEKEARRPTLMTSDKWFHIPLSHNLDLTLFNVPASYKCVKQVNSRAMR